MDIGKTNIALAVEANNAKTQREHDIAEAKLRGFRLGVATAICTDPSDLDVVQGTLIIEADQHYIDLGYEGGMCGGVWLDWEPSK